MGAVVDPVAGRRDPLAGRDRGGMADQGDQLALTTGLDPQDAKAVIGVLVGDALDGPAWRKANAVHVSLGQLKVMSAIESCRTAALGGHVARCEDCAYTTIAYNGCHNRDCRKC